MNDKADEAIVARVGGDDVRAHNIRSVSCDAANSNMQVCSGET